MDIRRLEDKVEVFELLPPDVLGEAVANRALAECGALLNRAITSDSSVEESDRLPLVGCVRRILTVVSPAMAEWALEPTTANELAAALQSTINNSQDSALQLEATLTLIDLEATGAYADRNAVASQVNALIQSGPIDAVRKLVERLGGPWLDDLPSAFDTLLRRCVQEPAVFDATLELTPEDVLIAWIENVLEQIPEHVLRTIATLELETSDLDSILRQAMNLATRLDSSRQLAILSEVAPLLDAAMDNALDAYAERLSAMLCDPSMAAGALELLERFPEHVQGGSRRQRIAADVFTWLNGIGDRNQPAAIDALIVLREQLTPEERGKLVGFLFDNIATRIPEVAGRAFGSLTQLQVAYDTDRGPNFDRLRIMYDEVDQPMRDVIGRGLARMKPSPLPRTKDASDFWRWARSLPELQRP